MKVINLFGGPSSGKSTIAAGLFYYMKVAGHNVELVTEYAKDLVYSDRLLNMVDQQEYIFAKQNHRQHVLRDKVDFCIVDSPILLSYIYPIINRELNSNVKEWPVLDTFRQFVLEVFNSYHNINFVLQRDSSSFQQDGRVHDLTQSQEIDQMILDVLDQHNISYYKIPSQKPSTIDTILNLLSNPEP